MRSTDDHTANVDVPEVLLSAMLSARSAPDAGDSWDRLESLAAELDRPEDAVRLYGEVLSSDLPVELVAQLGERATKYHDEWFGDDSPHLADLLQRVFDADPSSDWAFQRLTHAFTAAERWHDLLALYDKALERAKTKSRRSALLEEATNIAKDFAGDTDRAIHYLEAHRELKPRNKAIALTLERLLERHERWRELIALWTARLAELTDAEAAAARDRIATCSWDQLRDAGAAVSAAEAIVAAGDDDTEACRVADAVARDADTEQDTRDRALALLQQRYALAGRERDLVAVIESALPHVSEDRARQLREQAGHILATLGESSSSFDQFARVLEQDPGDLAAQEELRHLARQADAPAEALERYARVLLAAADRSGDTARATALRAEAAALFLDELDDAAAGVDALRAALAVDGIDDALAATLGRELDAALAGAGRHDERMDVLETLADVEATPAARRAALGELARVARSCGDLDRCARAWGRCVATDATDLEAIDALIDVQEARERWTELVTALRKRVDAQAAPHQQRADLARIARLHRDFLDDNEAAIATLRELHDKLGPTPETTDALAALLAATGAWDDYARVVDDAAARGARRALELLAAFGDACREQLGDARRAGDAYARALAIDPRHAGALAGLTALLDEDDARAAALEALAAAYERTGDWERDLELVDARLAGADDGDKLRILRGAARTAVRRAGDSARALGYAARALELAPDDEQLAAEVERLGGAAGAWTAVCDALAAAAAAAEPATASRLRAREGALREQRLDDRAAALDAYRAATEAQPGDAAVQRERCRLAIDAGQWGEASAAFVAHAALRGALDDALLARMERGAGSELRDAADALAAALAIAPEPLPGELAGAIEHTVARWLRDGVGDSGAAERALVRALEHTPVHRERLAELIALRRAAPTASLYDALHQYAAVVADDLDALCDAAELAADHLDDGELARSTLTSALQRAERLWRNNVRAAGRRAPEATANWALDQLVAAWQADGQPRRARDLALDALAWPIDDARRSELRERAAALSEAIGDTQRAVGLYRELAASRPDDDAVLDKLAALYDAQDDTAGTLWVRRRQLERVTDADRRVELRLDIARLVGVIEERGRRVETLLENLEDRPGHAATLAALRDVLGARGRNQELADVLARQARTATDRGERELAASLWLQTAELCERELGDPARALDAYTRAADGAAPSPAALDGLARLLVERGDHDQAATWLARLLDAAADADRGLVRLRLADALVAAGHRDRAIACLEADSARASDARARTRLIELYRASEALEPLARLLTSSLPHIADADEALAVAREAADLYRGPLAAPERAIPALRHAVGLRGDDVGLRQQLAQGMRLAGQYQEAREVAQAIVASFGRRRSPERAAAHYELALVARALGDADDALEQLDLATGMDVGNAPMLRTLAELAREHDQHDRAERAYRALLLAVRRREGDAGPEAVGESEVLFELHYLAAHAGDAERAEELKQSAVEAAVESDVELERARRTLLAHDDVATLRGLLDTRLEQVEDGPARTTLLAHLSDALARLGEAEDALDLAIEALRADPSRDALHTWARKLAAEADAIDEYTDAVRDIVSRSRREVDAERNAMLHLRLGEALEHDARDLAGAADAYKRAAESGFRAAEAYSALARVAGARGDAATQGHALDQLLAMVADAPPAARADALYQLAEIRAADAATCDEALDHLEAALEAESRHGRACAIVRAVLERAPEPDRALALYERVARRANDWEVLLDYFERRASHNTHEIDELREGIELAIAHDERARGRALLRRALDRARQSVEGVAGHLWAVTTMIELHRAAGELAEAAELVVETVDMIGPDPVEGIALQIAEHARAEGHGDVALGVLQALRNHRPAVRAVWQPLFELLRERGDRAALGELTRSTSMAVVDVKERNDLRLMYAEWLETTDDGAREAFEIYKDVLLDDPGSLRAAERIEALLEHTGTYEEIVAFLGAQLDDARERGDVDAATELALRLHARMVPVDAGEARGVLDQALELAPSHPALLRAMIATIEDDAEPSELADWKERLLDADPGSDAAGVALEIYQLRATTGDRDGARRALERGYAAAPGNADLRDRLQRLYRDDGLMRELAELLSAEARRAERPQDAVAMLTEVATIQRDMLMSSAGAIEALRLAAELAPQDTRVLGELVRTLQSEGDAAGALRELEAALERGIDQPGERTQAVLMLADARLSTGQPAAAVSGLERALGDGDLPDAALAALGDALDHALEAMRVTAAAAEDREAERTATLRIASRHLEAGRADAAHNLLLSWLHQAPDDCDVLRALAELCAADGQWDDVVTLAARLVLLEQGEPRLDAATTLADAAGRAAEPARARAALELAADEFPHEAALRAALRRIYEQTGAHRELAHLVAADARAEQDPVARRALLLHAADLLLATEAPQEAIPVLDEARALGDDDYGIALRMVDVQIATGQLEAARAALEPLTPQERTRSRGDAQILLRIARVERALGDGGATLRALERAFDLDRNDGMIAAELAVTAQQQRNFPLAIKALRAISLKELDGPMSPIEALLAEGRIELMRDNRSKAEMLARKVLRSHPDSPDAQALLEQAQR